MTDSKISLALATGLALALAACGDNEAEDTPAVTQTETAAVVAEFDPMTRDYTLSEDARTRRDAFDPDAFQQEYAGYRDEIGSEQVRMGDNRQSDGEMTDEDRAEMDAASQKRDANTNMRARENMTWSYLDRNDDGKLSVAEYAIWAIPLDPTAPKPNDQPPYLTADQANKAADSFFYYDQDGDTYLSQREFTSARRGDMVG